MSKESFLQKKEELLSQLVGEFISLKQESENFDKECSDKINDYRNVSDELKEKYKKTIEATGKKVYNILTEIGRIDLSIKDLNEGKNLKKTYYITADEYTPIMVDYLIPRILKITGETGDSSVAVAKEYENYFLNHIGLCGQYDKDKDGEVILDEFGNPVICDAYKALAIIATGLFYYYDNQEKKRNNLLNEKFVEGKNTLTLAQKINYSIGVIVSTAVGVLSGFTWGAGIGSLIGGFVGAFILPGVGAIAGAAIGVSIGSSFGHLIGGVVGFLSGLGLMKLTDLIFGKGGRKSPSNMPDSNEDIKINPKSNPNYINEFNDELNPKAGAPRKNIENSNINNNLQENVCENEFENNESNQRVNFSSGATDPKGNKENKNNDEIVIDVSSTSFLPVSN